MYICMVRDNASEQAQKILELLKALLNGISEDQSADDSQNEERQATFTQMQEEAQEVATRAAERRARLEDAVPLIEEELNDKLAQLSNKQQEEQRNLLQMRVLVDERAASRAAYEEGRSELTSAVEALKQAKAIVSTLKNTGFLQTNALAQLSEHQNKFQEFFPRLKRFRSLINQVFITMQDKSLHADQSTVDTIMNVIDELIEAVYAVQKQEMKADDARQSDYEAQMYRSLTNCQEFPLVGQQKNGGHSS